MPIHCSSLLRKNLENAAKRQDIEEYSTNIRLQGTKKIGKGRTQEGGCRQWRTTTSNRLWWSCDGSGYDCSDQVEEGPTNFTLMAYSSTSSNSEVSTDLNFENSEAKASEAKPKTVRKNNSAPIIEDWVSDSEEEDVPQTKIEKKTVNSSFAKIKSVKPKQQEKTARKTVNAVKASACWVWKPKTKVLDHVSKHNSASMNFKKFDYIDAQGRSNGCSRNMTWNMSYLTDFKKLMEDMLPLEVTLKEGKSQAEVKTVNGEVQLQALVDGKKIIVTESTMRRDLQLEDAEGVDCLPNATIFEQLTLMGYEQVSQKLTFFKAFFSPQWKFLIHTVLQCLSPKTTAWNEFSSNIASAIICLATSQKFNFSKLIFESMVKNLDNVGNFLMYPRFIQVFLDKQLEGMSNHKRIYIAPSHTKKIFGNMRRVGKGFSGRVTPLFPTMMVQAQQEQGEGSAMPTDPQHTPTITQPSTSQPKKTQKPRKPKKNTEVPQPSGSTEHVADEAINEEMDDSLVRAATTASSLEAEQDSGNIIKTRSKATPNEAGSQGTTSGGGPKPMKTPMSSDTKLTKDEEYLQEWISSDEASLGNQEDASKQGRKINDIDKDAKITLVDEAQGGQIWAEKRFNVAEKEVIKLLDPSYYSVNYHGRAEKPTKKKDQIRHDKEVSQRLQAQMQAELEEEDRLVRQRKEEANIVSWDNVLAMIDVDYQDGASTNAKLVEGSEKRTREELMQESAKKQKVDDDKEIAKLKNLMEVMPDKEEVALDAIPLAVKSPSIVDWKIHKEGKKSYYSRINEVFRSILLVIMKVLMKKLEILKKNIKFKGGLLGLKDFLMILKLLLLSAKLMLLVYKLLLMVFKVTTAERVSTIREWIKTEERIKIDWRSRLLT
ncbi:hypothetical protein Tco_0357565 [Tanacetum coccineum]